MKEESFWDQVRALKGITLHSIAQHKAYDVVEVTSDVVSLYVHDGGKTRKLSRADLEPFYGKLASSGELSGKELATVYKFNASISATLYWLRWKELRRSHVLCTFSIAAKYFSE